MILAFILTMPSKGSWNGQWSGEGELYCVTRSLRYSKKNKTYASKLIGDHRYTWPDGWGANIEVKQVTAPEARRLRQQSKGFCGYDWMVDNLMQHGDIRGR